MRQKDLMPTPKKKQNPHLRIRSSCLVMDQLLKHLRFPSHAGSKSGSMDLRPQPWIQWAHLIRTQEPPRSLVKSLDHGFTIPMPGVAMMMQVEESRKKPNAFREDMHGKWPDCGEDEGGNMNDPTREQFEKFHNEVRMNRDHAKDDIHDFMLAFQGAKVLAKIAKYLINCGFTIADIREQLGASEKGKESQRLTVDKRLDWNSQHYLEWREVAWNDLQRQSKFVRRAIRGAFNATSNKLPVFPPRDRFRRDCFHQSPGN